MLIIETRRKGIDVKKRFGNATKSGAHFVSAAAK